MVTSRASNATQRLPTMDTVTVEWDECYHSGGGPSVEGGAFSHIMQAARGSLEPMLPCSSAGCRGGGFEILEVVESMVSNRLEDKSGLLVCIGWEYTKGRQTAQSPCTRVISYRIGLTYRKRGDSLRHSTARKDMIGTSEA
ncbi:MAG: hypothetical protein K8G79_02825 [bacterium]|uniref:Uncharacterized protein n=1 Tax=Candidatus Methylomirabilis tolerans TaxID=3123416 RepID=A0AAJ1AG58_9BACT|nr:hypothetical protein [Candidatus Methylomirabilis sp.]